MSDKAISALAVSPKMLVLSVLLHAIAVMAALYAYSSVARPDMPSLADAARVKLVSHVPAEPKVDRIDDFIEAEPVKLEPSEVAERVEPEQKPEPPPKRIETAEKREKPPQLRLEKRKVPRKRPPEKQAEAKKAPGKPPKEKPSHRARRPDPKAALEKKLAAIRRRVEQRKKSDASESPDRGGAASNLTTGQHGAAVDRELLRWLGLVRGRINQHWSIATSTGEAGSETIIRVRIGEDGSLLAASVNRSSGDIGLDRSAMRAVYQAAPYPRMPAEVRKRIRAAGGLAMRFTPEGLE